MAEPQSGDQTSRASESAVPYPDDDTAASITADVDADADAEADVDATAYSAVDVDEASATDDASSVQDLSDPAVADPSVAAVHAAVGELDDIDGAPLTEHADRYERVHGALQDVLADTDPGLGRA